MAFKVVLTTASGRDLKALQKRGSKRDLKRVDARILSLAENPLPRGVKKLEGTKDIFRVRVGDYRILYTINDQDHIIEVARVRHRPKAYR